MEFKTRKAFKAALAQTPEGSAMAESPAGCAADRLCFECDACLALVAWTFGEDAHESNALWLLKNTPSVPTGAPKGAHAAVRALILKDLGVEQQRSAELAGFLKDAGLDGLLS